MIKLRKETNKYINEKEIWELSYQILVGVEYLHNSVNIMHWDIKCQNLFLMSDFVVKIGDFGVSKTFTNIKDRQ